MDGPANRHGFAYRFHRGGQQRFRAGEFFKGKARDFGDDIVDGRLETGGCHLGDVIVQLVQRIADCQFRRDFGDRKTCGLGCQCR